MREGLSPGVGLAVLRLVIGIIFIAHGSAKLFGGIEGASTMLAGVGVPFPLLAAWVIALLETAGGAALAIGAWVGPIAGLLTVHMVAGIFLVHMRNGFFVIGPGSGGVELNLLLSAGLLTLILAGPGHAALGSRRQKEILVA